MDRHPFAVLAASVGPARANSRLPALGTTTPLPAPTPTEFDCAAIFGVDALGADMQFVTAVTAPLPGKKVLRVDDRQARGVAGVTQVLVLDELVAVVAGSERAARLGAERLEIVWSAAAASLLDELAAAARGSAGEPPAPAGLAIARAGAVRWVDAVYPLDMQAAPAAAAPSCIVRLEPGTCSLWLDTQIATQLQAVAARLTGLPLAAVKVYDRNLGQRLGPRVETTLATQALRIARRLNGVLKVSWRDGVAEPADGPRGKARDVLSAGLGADGLPVAWSHRVFRPHAPTRVSHQAWRDPAPAAASGTTPPHAEPCNPYDVPAARLVDAGPDPDDDAADEIRHSFVAESFVDELAATAQRDPLAYRLALLNRLPRARAVLGLAAARAGWGEALPPKHGRGLAVACHRGSFSAQVAEVSVADDGSVTVGRIVCVADCGRTSESERLDAQLLGAIELALAATLWGEIRVDVDAVVAARSGAPVAGTTPLPDVDTLIVASDAAPGQRQALGSACTAPAIVNAIFAATGTRLRRLPVDIDRLRQPGAVRRPGIAGDA